MLTNDCIEAAIQELRTCGIEPSVKPSGKHAAVSWNKNGTERTYYTALTPSDHRAPLNVRSDVRRILREDGIIVDEKPVEAGDRPRLFLAGGSFHCSSLDVASHFSKAHKNVLRDIDRILLELGDEFGRLNFEPTDFVDSHNRQQRAFNLTRDGFMVLAMGFSGTEAMKWKVRYIEAFNIMEAELRSVSCSALASPEIVARIEKVEGDLSALVDLCLASPQPEPGYIVIKAHKRRVRGVRA